MTWEIDRRTSATQARYDRIAHLYDAMEWFTEMVAFQHWREDLWSCSSGGDILEVGVGTGKNLPYYPGNAKIEAIDLSRKMLEKAKERAKNLDISIKLRQMDVQHLGYPDDKFDAAVATFVFCSVPIPVQGLRELGRVVKPKGGICLIEHVRINKPIVGSLMDMINPLVVRVMGANINRQTVKNVRDSGLEIQNIETLSGELIKLIHATA